MDLCGIFVDSFIGPARQWLQSTDKV